MPTPLKREETEYPYDASLDALYQVEVKPPQPPQKIKRADTEYDFDEISTQGLEQVAEIERQALAKMDHATPVPTIVDDGVNTEAIMNEVSAILQDGRNPEATEHSEEEMDVGEDADRPSSSCSTEPAYPPFIHLLAAVWDYKALNEEILATMSEGAVAYIPGHFESRFACWSPHTCFAELGVKPQFEVTLNDQTTTVISLADILNDRKHNLLFVPTSQWCLPPSMQELEDSYNTLWGNKNYTFAPPDAAHSHSFLHFFIHNPETFKRFSGAITCTMMQVKHGNGSIIFSRHDNWASCPNIDDLRTMVTQMKSDTPPERNIRYMRVNIAPGDCFVIPPGTQYEVHPSSNLILATSKFFHRCNLQQTYGLVRIKCRLPGDRGTLENYWRQVYHDIVNVDPPPSLSKLRAIMRNPLEPGEIILFSGKGWLYPFL